MVVSTLFVPNNPFVFTVKTDNAGTSTSTQFSLPLAATATCDCYVYWGDGTTSRITSRTDPAWTHTYPIAGTYTVQVYGILTGIRFAGGGDRLKFLNISQWGTNFKLGNAGTSFWGCSNLTITATDVLNTNGLTNLEGIFIGCTSLTSIPNIGKWDVSQVTSILNTFNACSNLAPDIANWNVSNLVNMGTAFFSTKANFSLATWNTSKVTDMSSAWRACSLFNQNISVLDTSKVTNMSNMLRDCTAFQQNIGSLNIAGLTNAADMLTGVTLTNANYNGLLAGFSANPNRKNNVTFSGGNSHYDTTSGGFNGTAGRAILTGTNLWTITDGGTP